MSKTRRAAILSVAALWSAGVYALVWLIISTFVPANITSHYYSTFLFPDFSLVSRWWGALFAPMGSIVAISVYFLWVTRHDNSLKGLMGFCIAILMGVINTLVLFFVLPNVFPEVLFVGLFGFSTVLSFSLVLWSSFSGTKSEFYGYLLAVGLNIGTFLTLGLVFYSIPGAVVFSMLLLATSCFGWICGVVLGLVKLLTLKGLVNLHKLAFGIEKKDEEE